MTSEVTMDRGFASISREVRGSVRLEAELSGELTHKVSLDAQLRDSRPAGPVLSDAERERLAQAWHQILVDRASEAERGPIIDAEAVQEAIAAAPAPIARASEGETQEDPSQESFEGVKAPEVGNGDA